MKYLVPLFLELPLDLLRFVLDPDRQVYLHLLKAILLVHHLLDALLFLTYAHQILSLVLDRLPQSLVARQFPTAHLRYLVLDFGDAHVLLELGFSTQ